ncbi:MAG: FAD-dependent oxidoreductase [Saprospiraceae bacterium]
MQILEIKVHHSKISDKKYVDDIILKKLKVIDDVVQVDLVKKSIDARGKQPIYILKYSVYQEGDDLPQPFSPKYRNVSECKEVIIVGAGPAGYFAALELLEIGLKPIIFERGKDVQARRRDLKAIMQDDIVNPNSNYCFGEGGAGTFSDGKLYTRSLKRGSGRKVLETLVFHGAQKEILIDAHPHIGSNKLPKVITQIRETIEYYGGEVRFNKLVDDIIISEEKQIKGVICGGKCYYADAVILATGHSARDIFYLLNKHGITLDAKPFALGLRIEHLQNMIDKAQYNLENRGENLPASAYSVVTQVDGKGVFSFCMCPGGLIVPASTNPNEIVVNGMSLSRRDSPFANSGFVTSIELDELAEHGYTGIFAALDFQTSIENAMSTFSNGTQKAPAQRVKDFIDGKTSTLLNPTSYIPGLVSAPLHELLPPFIYKRLRQGLIQIDKQKIKGYASNDANIVAVESRTSSPIRIPRNSVTYMHDQIEGLFPCGEGAGYAGGILSAAMDGQNVASAVSNFILNKKC